VHSRRHEWQCHRYALDMESITPAVLISHQMFVHYTPKCCFATTFEVHTRIFDTCLHSLSVHVFACVVVFVCTSIFCAHKNQHDCQSYYT
jgi:hypothetical protein